MLKVNGAWYINQLPQHIVLELDNGSLTKVQMTPFRIISERDFSPYNGYHPRKCKGQPLPDYLYRFYGIDKNKESATEVIHIRVTPAEKAKVDAAAKNDEKSISELVRDYIKGL